MILRRWSDTVLAEYREDGNPFGGSLIRVQDSNWDSGEVASEMGTDVRECEWPSSEQTPLGREPRSNAKPDRSPA